MKILPLHRLGAHVSADGSARFEFPLPWVSGEHGNRLWLKVIHEKDQFLQDIQPFSFEMSHSVDSELGDSWSVTFNIHDQAPSHPRSAWGQAGRYVYRFLLENPNHPSLDWIIDPFAREFGTGKLSAFTLGYEPHVWSDNELSWKTPGLSDLVIYELMIGEFAGTVDRAIERLPYLADLGVNCLELMPVSNVLEQIDWGFMPVGYFGIDERFGKRRDMQRFVDAAHRAGLAVIVDSVYGHTSAWFPYSYVYRHLQYHENPFMGSFAKDYFGESTDFNREFTRDFFATVNHHWLDCYHVDGFRYDCVPNYWDGATGTGYARLTFETYRHVQAQQAQGGHWQRFLSDGNQNLIQCAEQLEGPVEILEHTYSNSTWQNETLGTAAKVASGDFGQLTEYGFRTGASGYPPEKSVNGDRIPKAPLQYVENHDHERFVCRFGLTHPTGDRSELLKSGDRGRWYKVQPYLFALLTGRGVPMLWQGGEFVENYFVPHEGWGRVMLFRPVHWDYFYSGEGRSMVNLTRKLLKLRKENVQFRDGDHFFYNHYDNYQSKGCLLYSRANNGRFSLVALNFSDETQWVPFEFPFDGEYEESVHGGSLSLSGISEGQQSWLELPSNYGRVWTHHA